VTEQEIQEIADSVVEPDDYIAVKENHLLQALLYLVHAEQGMPNNLLPQCCQVLRETLRKARSRSTSKLSGNPTWVLLQMFVDARLNHKLSADAWALWLVASDPPGILRRTIPGLLYKLDILAA
jgi:hypothetical protein